MELKLLDCPVCGANGKLTGTQENGYITYTCAHCGNKFTEDNAKREYEKLEAGIQASIGTAIENAILREKTAIYYNLRSQLWEKINASYIDSKAILDICRQIKALAPHDFLAEFFELANSGSVKEVADYINGIDVHENALFLDLVLDFLIRSIRGEYITPIAALLDRAGAVLSPEEKQKYLTRFEKEAAKVQEGLYDLTVPRDVFLAYSSKDMKKVIEVLNFIEASGLTCFAAFRNLQHGRDAVANYEKALHTAIDNSSIFVFVSSVNSRNNSCDAMTREIPYIKSRDMQKAPEARTYSQIPEKYKTLKVEYRLDNTPTPLADRTLKDFFAGLTYAENFDQLINRLGECMDVINAPTNEDEKDDAELRLAEETRKAKEAELRSKELELELEKVCALETNSEEARKTKELSKYYQIEDGFLKKVKDQYMKNKEFVIPDCVTEIGSRAFSDCKSLTSITIPDSVTYISEDAFSRCKSLTSITIPDSVTSIDYRVFERCTSLTSITIPDSVTSIGDWAFYGCEKLTSITIADSVTSIDNGAFRDCSSLTSITIPDSVTSIDEAFYNCSSLTSVTIGNSVTSIGSYAFYNCSSLTSITIPNGVTSIGKNAFYGCRGLTSITIPDSVTSIGEEAFRGCSSLTSITIPDSVTSIGDSAFDSCSSLTSITIPDSVTSIGDSAFSSCSSLTSITIGKSITSMGNGAFGYCETLEEFYFNANAMNNFEANTRIFSYRERGKGIKVIIGKNVTMLPSGLFGDVPRIVSVTFEKGSTCESIDSAFRGCSSLTSVTIPDSVTSIGDFAFKDCTSLTSVTIGNSVTSIGDFAFQDCSSLTSVTIPDSVASIGSYAFEGCKCTINIRQRKPGLFNNCPFGWDKGWNRLFEGKIVWNYKK